jgi:hypothetical protein
VHVVLLLAAIGAIRSGQMKQGMGTKIETIEMTRRVFRSIDGLIPAGMLDIMPIACVNIVSIEQRSIAEWITSWGLHAEVSSDAVRHLTAEQQATFTFERLEKETIINIFSKSISRKFQVGTPAMLALEHSTRAENSPVLIRQRMARTKMPGARNQVQQGLEKPLPKRRSCWRIYL